jgi:tryptophanyl-tRNA synthetase
LHIGNYFGALKKWVEFQNSYQCVFGIVDLHALTEGPEPKKLKQNIFETALDFLAAGLDPGKSILMIQSYVPEHSELAWIFNCITPISKLERVPTFKDKALQFKNNLNMGLLDYPALMAADILIYKADAVPVGEDQMPHLELAREIARTFNNKFGQTFPEPKEILGEGARIMGLDNPEKKMSKSLGQKNYIALADSPETIKSKLASAVTDTGNDARSPKRPGVANLFTLLKLFSDKKTLANFEKDYHAKKIKYSEVKQVLAKDIAGYFSDFRKKREALAKNPAEVWKILEDGSQKAQAIARKTLQEVKEKVGLR